MTEPRKYRGIAEGKWVKGWYCEAEGKSIIIEGNFLVRRPFISQYAQVIPETVGQSTNLKGKNGKPDLYAGDRIAIGSDRGVLVWDEYEFAWALQVDDGEIQVICRFYSQAEIDNIGYLGTIHDHLLKGDK